MKSLWGKLSSLYRRYRESKGGVTNLSQTESYARDEIYFMMHHGVMRITVNHLKWLLRLPNIYETRKFLDMHEIPIDSFGMVLLADLVGWGSKYEDGIDVDQVAGQVISDER